MWELYDRLIEGIDAAVTVDKVILGPRYALVRYNGGAGVAMYYTGSFPEIPFTYKGAGLRDVAALSKSWSFMQAAIGVAALNAWYNQPQRLPARTKIADGTPEMKRALDPFELYRSRVTGKKVATVGHFCYVDYREAELSVLERDPSPGDYPDIAAEYLLPQQDFVFITGSTMVNKSLPRLLEVSRNATTILVGPTVTMSPVLFDFGVDSLAGYMVTEPELCEEIVSAQTQQRIFDAGRVLILQP